MEPHRDARAEISAWLQRQPGKHLVLVRYRPWHSPDVEWVYNGADIDASHVVWARDMKPPENAEITAYFRDRRVWLLEADLFPPRVVRYPPLDSDSRE